MAFSVVVDGSLREGVSREQALTRLAVLFRIDDVSRLDRYFAGGEVIIKGGLDAIQAEKYRIALEKAGLLAVVREEEPAAGTPAPAPTSSESPATASATPGLPPASVSATPATSGDITADSPPTSPPVWWVVRGNHSREGPKSREQLVAMAADGRIGKEDGIWKSGLDQPVPAKTLAWLQLPAAAAAHGETRDFSELLRQQEAKNPDYAKLLQLRDIEQRPPHVGLFHAYFRYMQFMVCMVSAFFVCLLLFWSFKPLLFMSLSIGLPLMLTTLYARRKNLRGYRALRDVFLNMQFLCGLLFMVTAFLLFHTAGYDQWTADDRADMAAFNMSDSVAAQNRSLPRMISHTTRFDRVTIVGHTLTYYYTRYGFDLTMLGLAHDTRLRQSDIKRDCADPQALALLNKGIIYRVVITYELNDPGQSRVTDYQYGIKDCHSADAAPVLDSTAPEAPSEGAAISGADLAPAGKDTSGDDSGQAMPSEVAEPASS